jgi:hypothetical protein
MRGLSRPLITVACAALIASGLAFAHPAQAAAYGCYKSTCQGQNPYTKGCNADQIFVDQIWKDDMNVNLLFDWGCYANWATLNASVTEVHYVSVISDQSGGSNHWADCPNGQGAHCVGYSIGDSYGFAYTKMVNGVYAAVQAGEDATGTYYGSWH